MGYKGLCIGGVRAGEWVSNDNQKFFDGLHPGRNIMSDGTPLYIDVPYDADVGSMGTNYVHVQGGGGCDFWVPQGKDRIWAMQELVRCYRREHLRPDSEADPD